MITASLDHCGKVTEWSLSGTTGRSTKSCTGPGSVARIPPIKSNQNTIFAHHHLQSRFCRHLLREAGFSAVRACTLCLPGPGCCAVPGYRPRRSAAHCSVLASHGDFDNIARATFVRATGLRERQAPEETALVVSLGT